MTHKWCEDLARREYFFSMDLTVRTADKTQDSMTKALHEIVYPAATPGSDLTKYPWL